MNLSLIIKYGLTPWVHRHNTLLPVNLRFQFEFKTYTRGGTEFLSRNSIMCLPRRGSLPHLGNLPHLGFSPSGMHLQRLGQMHLWRHARGVQTVNDEPDLTSRRQRNWATVVQHGSSYSARSAPAKPTDAYWQCQVVRPTDEASSLAKKERKLLPPRVYVLNSNWKRKFTWRSVLWRWTHGVNLCFIIRERYIIACYIFCLYDLDHICSALHVIVVHLCMYDWDHIFSYCRKKWNVTMWNG